MAKFTLYFKNCVLIFKVTMLTVKKKNREVQKGMEKFKSPS